MSERLIEKIDRLGAEAGVETMTPEIRRFALLVRQDTVAQWPKREWVELTDGEIATVIRPFFQDGQSDADFEIDLPVYRALLDAAKELNT